MRRILFTALSLVFLAGCSTTFPVSGKVTRTNERFIGTATSVLGGTSTLKMTTDNGVKCNGEYIAPVVWTMTQGATFDGTFTCDDGRSGTFTVTGTALRGEGFGKMNNGDKLVFTYGDSSIVKVRE